MTDGTMTDGTMTDDMDAPHVPHNGVPPQYHCEGRQDGEASRVRR